MADPLLPGIYAPDSDAIYSANQPFATPEQIAQQRAYARALMDKSTEGPYVGKSGKFESVSPWGVAGQLGQAAAGQFINYRQAQNERQMHRDYGRAQTRMPIPGLEQMSPDQISGNNAGDGGDWHQAIPTMVNIESGGNPNAHTGSYSGLLQMGPEERAKYGGNSLASGTRMLEDEAKQLTGILGRPPTGAEVYLAHQQGIGGFKAHMANPDAPAWQNMLSTDEGRSKGAGWARQAVWGNVPDSMKAAFGGVDNITSRDFMNMWRTRVDSGHFDRGAQTSQASPMQFALSSPQPDPYGNGRGAWDEQPGGGPAHNPTIAFSGQPQDGGGGAPNAQDAIVSALRGGQPAGPAYPSQAVPGRAPTPDPQQSGQGGMAGGFFPQRPQMSHQQAQDIFTSPLSTPQDKEYARSVLYGQGQPTSIQGPFGWTYVRDAHGNVVGVAPAPSKSEVQVGDVHVPKWQYPTPQGGIQNMPSAGGAAAPITTPPQGAGSNVPQPAGSFGIGGGTGDIRPPTQPVAPTPGPRSEAEPAGAPVKVASLETGTKNDAGGPLAYAPPAVGATSTPSPAPRGTQVAQNKNFSDMSDEELANYSQERSLGLEQAKKDIETYNKDSQDKIDAGQTAQSALPQIKLLSKLFQDPNLIQGPWSSVKQGINDVFTGLTGNEAATKASTLKASVDKLVAGGILDKMRATLQGLGQVRVAEINLLSTASASTYNTPQANAAIMFMTQRAAERQADIGRIATAYRNGARWDANGNPTTAQGGDRPTMAGLNQAIQTYMDKHPFLSDGEITDLQKTLDGAESAGPRKQAGGPTAADARAELEARKKKASGQ